MVVHETSMKEHLTNFTMVTHGNNQKNAHAYNEKKPTTTKSHAFPKQTRNNKIEMEKNGYGTHTHTHTHTEGKNGEEKKRQLQNLNRQLQNLHHCVSFAW